MNIVYHQASQINATCFTSQYRYELPSIHPKSNPDSKFHGANMGPIWGRQDPGGQIIAENRSSADHDDIKVKLQL